MNAIVRQDNSIASFSFLLSFLFDIFFINEILLSNKEQNGALDPIIKMI